MHTFKDLNKMTVDEFKNEIHTLRQIATRRLKFWEVIDRVFRWKIFHCSVRNPLAYGVENFKGQKTLSFMTWTDSPSFQFEEFLDQMVKVMVRDVLRVAKIRPEGFVIKTPNGKYEIIIRKFPSGV